MSTTQTSAPEDVIDVAAMPVADQDLEALGEELADLDGQDELGEDEIPAKKKSDFFVEFLQAEKKAALTTSEGVGNYIKSMNIFQMSVDTAPVRKKKKRPVQENMPWVLDVTFFDDIDNAVVEFLEACSQEEAEFRIRVTSLTPQGMAIEQIIFKQVKLMSSQRSYQFDIEQVRENRTLPAIFHATEVRRRSMKPAK